MRISTVAASVSRRVGVMLVAAAILAGWVFMAGGLGSNGLVGVSIALALLVLGLVKAVLELIVDARALRRGMATLAGEFSEYRVDLDRVSASGVDVAAKQSNFNNAIVGRIRTVESTVGDQSEFGEGVLRRVRAVESAVGDQSEFGEGVLRRVRAVESATVGQRDLHDAVLRRIKASEERIAVNQGRIRDRGADLDALVRALSALQTERDHSASRHRELELSAALQRLSAELGSSHSDLPGTKEPGAG